MTDIQAARAWVEAHLNVDSGIPATLLRALDALEREPALTADRRAAEEECELLRGDRESGDAMCGVCGQSFDEKIASITADRDRLAARVTALRTALVGVANRFIDPVTHPESLRKITELLTGAP